VQHLGDFSHRLAQHCHTCMLALGLCALGYVVSACHCLSVPEPLMSVDCLLKRRRAARSASCRWARGHNGVRWVVLSVLDIACCA
jgi:hypothetical protein